MSLPLRGRAGGNWLRNRQKGKYRRSSLDAIARLHLDGSIAIEQNIHAGTELDESNPLAAGYVVSHLKIENDAARDHACNRRAVHVDVENAEKNADPVARSSAGGG